MELAHITSLGVDDAKKLFVSGGVQSQQQALPLSGIKTTGGRKIECITALPRRVTVAPLLSPADAAVWGAAKLPARAASEGHQGDTTTSSSSQPSGGGYFSKVSSYDSRELSPNDTTTRGSTHSSGIVLGEVASRAVESEAAFQRTRTSASPASASGTNNTYTDDVLNLPLSTTALRPGMILRPRDRYVSYLYCGMSDGSVAQYGVSVSLTPSSAADVAGRGTTGPVPPASKTTPFTKPPSASDPFSYVPGDARHMLDSNFLQLAAPYRHAVHCEEVFKRTLRSGDGPVSYLHCVIPQSTTAANTNNKNNTAATPEAQLVALRGNRLMMLNSLSLDVEPTFSHFPPLEGGVSLCCVATPASLGSADASGGGRLAAHSTGVSGKVAAIVKKVVVCMTFNGTSCRSYYGSGETTSFLSSSMSPKSTTAGGGGASSTFDGSINSNMDVGSPLGGGADGRATGTQQPIMVPDNTTQIAWHLDCIILGTQKEYFIFNAITGQVLDQVTLDKAALRPDMLAAGILPLLKSMPDDMSLEVWGDESAMPMAASGGGGGVGGGGESALVDYRIAETLLLESKNNNTAMTMHHQDGGGGDGDEHSKSHGAGGGTSSSTGGGAVAVRLPHLRFYDGRHKEPLETARKATFLNSEECYQSDYNHPVQMGMSAGFVSVNGFNSPSQAQLSQYVKAHPGTSQSDINSVVVFPYVPVPRLLLRHAFDLGQLPMHMPLPGAVTQHAGMSTLPSLPISVSRVMLRTAKILYHLAHTAGTKGQGQIISAATLAALGEGHQSKQQSTAVVATPSSSSTPVSGNRPMPTTLNNPDFPSLSSRKHATATTTHNGYIPANQPTTQYPMLVRHTTSQCPTLTFFTVAAASSLCAAGLDQQQQMYENSSASGGLITASSLPTAPPVTQSHTAHAHTVAVAADNRDVYCAVTLPPPTLVTQLALSGSYERALCYYVSYFMQMEDDNRLQIAQSIAHMGSGGGVSSSYGGSHNNKSTIVTPTDLTALARMLLNSSGGGCGSQAVLHQTAPTTSGPLAAPLPISLLTSTESAVYDHRQQLSYLASIDFTQPTYRIVSSIPFSIIQSAHVIADTLYSGDVLASAVVSAHHRASHEDVASYDYPPTKRTSPSSSTASLKPIMPMNATLAALTPAERCRLGLNHTHLICGSAAWNSRQFGVALYHLGVCCGTNTSEMKHLNAGQTALAGIHFSVIDVGAVLDAIPEFRFGFGHEDTQNHAEASEAASAASFAFGESSPMFTRLRNASHVSNTSLASPSRNASIAPSTTTTTPPHFLPRLDERSAKILQTVSLADLGADGCHQLARMLLQQRQVLAASIKVVRAWIKHHPAGISMQALASALKINTARENTSSSSLAPRHTGGGGEDTTSAASPSPARKVGFAIPSPTAEDEGGYPRSTSSTHQHQQPAFIGSSGPGMIPADLLAAAAYLKRLHLLADDVEYALLHMMTEALAPFSTAEANGLFFPVCRLDLDECMPSLQSMMTRAESLRIEASNMDDDQVRAAKEEEATRMSKRCARFHSLLLSAAGRLTEALELCRREGLVAEAVVPLQWSCFKPQQAVSSNSIANAHHSTQSSSSAAYVDPISSPTDTHEEGANGGHYSPYQERSRSASIRLLDDDDNHTSSSPRGGGGRRGSGEDGEVDTIMLFTKHIPWMMKKDPVVTLSALTGARSQKAKTSTSANPSAPSAGDGGSDEDEDGGEVEAFLNTIDEEEGDGLVGIVNVEDTDDDDDSSHSSSAAPGELMGGESMALFSTNSQAFRTSSTTSTDFGGGITPSISSLRTASTQRSRGNGGGGQQRRHKHKAAASGGKLVFSPPPAEAIVPIFLRNALRGAPLYAYLHHLISSTKTRDPSVHTLHALNLIEMVGAVLRAVLPPQPATTTNTSNNVAGLNDDDAAIGGGSATTTTMASSPWHPNNLDVFGRPCDDELLLPAGQESGVLGRLRGQLIDYLQRPTSMYDTDIIMVRLRHCEGAGWWNPGKLTKIDPTHEHFAHASVSLVPEQAAVYVRRGDDDQVLSTLVYGLNAMELAEAYCDAQHHRTRTQALAKAGNSIPQQDNSNNIHSSITPILSFITPEAKGFDEDGGVDGSGGVVDAVAASPTLRLVLVVEETSNALSTESTKGASSTSGGGGVVGPIASPSPAASGSIPLHPASPLLHSTFYSAPLLRLLRVLLFPPRSVSQRVLEQQSSSNAASLRSSPGGAQRIDDAVELMERRADDLDAEEVLNMLPSTLEISRLCQFLRLSYQNQLHRSKMLSVLEGCSHTYLAELAVQRSLLTQRCVYVDEQRPCVVCGKPVGDAVIGVFPNLKIAHFRCFKSVHVDPERLVPFSMAF